LAPAVVEKRRADSDVSIPLECVLRRAMPLDWQEQRGAIAGAVDRSGFQIQAAA